MSREQNRKYIRGIRNRRLWLSAVVGGLSLAYIARELRLRLDLASIKLLLPLVVGSVLGVGIVWWMMHRTSRAMARALRSPTPEELVATIERSFRMARIPDKPAFLAGAKSAALALYGQGLQAREELAQVDWQRLAPIVQAIGAASESLIALLCHGDFAQGLKDAQRAHSLAAIDPGTFGSTASNRFYAAVLACAQVFAGEKDATTLPTLEAATKAKLYPTLRAIAMAGLAVDAHRAGSRGELEARRIQLASFAPTLDELLFGRSEPPSVA